MELNWIRFKQNVVQLDLKLKICGVIDHAASQKEVLRSINLN
jgi:hypothetical protein